MIWSWMKVPSSGDIVWPADGICILQAFHEASNAHKIKKKTNENNWQLCFSTFYPFLSTSLFTSSLTRIESNQLSRSSVPILGVSTSCSWLVHAKNSNPHDAVFVQPTIVTVFWKKKHVIICKNIWKILYMFICILLNP